MTKSTKPKKVRHGKPAPAAAAKAKAPQPASDEERQAAALRASVNYVVPQGGVVADGDTDLFRFMLARRMVTFMKLPRRCGEPLCRRTGRCVGPTMRCQRDFAASQLTPEEKASTQVEWRRLLERRIAELRG